MSRSHKLVLVALILVLTASCKSHKKTAAITNPNIDKPKTETALPPKPSESEELKKLEETRESTYKGRLTQYFDAITTSPNVAAANTNIDEALALFASPQTPVLIVISEEGGEKDYDKPTTIREYLNYLKDQKKNMNRVGDLKVDASGKITEVELRKNN